MRRTLNVLTQEKVDSINQLLIDGYGIRKIMGKVSVAKETVRRYRTLLLKENIVFCKCGQKIGHKGFCSYRVSIYPQRQEFLLTNEFFGGRVPATHRRSIELDRYLRWPYSVYGKNIPEIIIKVDESVPLTVPEKIRPDICQDIIVDLLSGIITPGDIQRCWKTYMNKAYRGVSDYRVKSIYDTVKGTDHLMVIDSLTDENTFFS
jgi:hypothetical protein